MAVYVRFRLIGETPREVEYEAQTLEGSPERLTLDLQTYELTIPEDRVTHATQVAAAKIMREYRRLGHWPKGGAVQS